MWAPRLSYFNQRGQALAILNYSAGKARHKLDLCQLIGGNRGRPMVEITFLGTGNAFCPTGRLHSLVLIDGNMLVDAPPTVIPQLRQHGISPAVITDLFITHWHGDHIFGLPFLVARIFRPTLLDVFGITNLQLGAACSVYGIVAMLAYFPGGTLADRFSARVMMYLAAFRQRWG